MCYWVIPITGAPVADTTVQHITRDDMNDPTIKMMIEEFNTKLTANLNNSNFDNPDIVDFHLTNEISLLDEHICNCSPVDSAYRDTSSTPTDEDTAEHRDRPDDDNIDINVYGKLIGSQILLDNGLKATVK
ncbi:hypothetical protein HJC23_012348 [Cyclotella cryptica]|uniref:Uncharacterized protein n=1 Tax=Cyclotella cryptica TaxID=29204 RepID=A0ABD3QCI3_9STRA